MTRAQKARWRPLRTEEREALVKVTEAGRARVDRVRRAGAQGATFTQAAERAGFRSHSTVTGLVGRFTRRGRAAWDVAAGRGR